MKHVRDNAVRPEWLTWPHRRNCDWDCPWPNYCIECHGAAWEAMWAVRNVVFALLGGRVHAKETT